MRLVAWNANYNGRHRSLEQDVALLAHLDPDVVVLSETSPPSEENPYRAHYFGSGTPGLAVVARAGLQLRPMDINQGAPTIMGGLHVSGDLAFNLLAVWPVSREGETYHQILMQGLARFAEALTSPAIVAGDFNSTARVVRQARSHPEFVEAAAVRGLVSVYHSKTGEAHGEETVGTYRHNQGSVRDFHIDYCFVSRSLVDFAEVEVVRSAEWEGLSDHYPLVLDIEDSALSVV